MGNNFAAGESDADTAGPPITQETMGARNVIQVTSDKAGRGIHEQQRVNYLMPSVHYVNGNMETVAPAITLTPLGGMMPGPNAIAPAIPDVTDYRAPVPDEFNGFGAGVADAYPEGCPVPHR